KYHISYQYSDNHFFCFSSRRRHTSFSRDWSSDVCSSDLYFLQEQQMTRYDAVNYISHGIAKRPGGSEARPPRGADEDQASAAEADRKSTRLNSSHVKISYAVFCLKKKNSMKLIQARAGQDLAEDQYCLLRSSGAWL